MFEPVLNSSSKKRTVLRALGASLLISTALVGVSVGQEVIDGSVENVNGGGGGTKPHPWNIAGDLTVGENATGALTIENGGTVTNTNGRIGGNVGSNGTVNVTGAGSSWTNSNFLYVGNMGEGALNIDDALVTSMGTLIAQGNNTVGTVNVTGSNATFATNGMLSVGFSGLGTLTATEGATVNANVMIVGFSSGGDNSSVVIDNSTLDVNGYVTIGRINSASMTIRNGASLMSDGLFTVGQEIAGNDQGTLTVTGSGTTWNTAGLVYVGSGAKGVVNISDSAVVTGNNQDISIGRDHSTLDGQGTLNIDNGTWNGAGEIYLGHEAGSTGTLNVSNNGSIASNDTVYVGNAGEGVLTLASGGTLSTTGDIRVGEEAGSTGTINIGAASGDTAVGAGALSANQIVFDADGTSNLVFNHTDTNYNFSTDISGSGTISHLSGTTTYAGDASGFTGTIALNGGTFKANNSFSGTFTVGGGGQLGGSGNIGSVALNSGGTLAPGNSIGTLTTANATFNTGSTFEVEIKDGGTTAGVHNDLLNTGTATINGGTVHVKPENGTDTGNTYAPGTYTIISATNLTGSFDNVTDDFLFLDFAASYDAQKAYLTSTRQAGFSSFAQTNNQKAVAGTVDAMSSGDAVFDALLGLTGSGAQARAAYDALSGEIHASTQTGLMQQSRSVQNSAIEQLSAEKGPNAKGFGAFYAAFGGVFGAQGQWASDGNAAEMTGSGGGVRVGALSKMDESTKIGVIAEYQKSYFSVPDRSSTSNSDSFMVGVFGEREFDQFVLSGGVTNSWHLINTDRDVRLTGLNDDLTANYGAQTLGGWVELSKEFEGNGFAYAPFANLSLAHHTTNSFTENGGAAALRSTGDVSQSAVSTVGVRVQTQGAFENTQYTARGMIGWQHSFAGAPTLDLQFASGGNSFNVAGVPESRDALVVETGVNFEIGTNANLDLSYNGLFSNTGQHHSANIDMRVGF